ncbi:MAG: EamA family transporter, partial [Clostridia bacterium]
MQVIYPILTACILFFQGFFYKVFAHKCTAVGETNDYVLNVYDFAICVVIMIPIAFIGQSVSVPSLLYGLIQGLFFCGMIVFYNKAMSQGQMAFTNFVMALAMIIPLVGGSILYGEKISVLQYVGLGVFAVACYLMCFGASKKSSGTKTPLRAYIYAFLGAIGSGCVSLFIKVSVNKIGADNINQMQFLLSAFVVSLVLSIVMSGASTKFHFRKFIPNKWFYICGAVIAIVTVGGNIAFNIFSVMTEGAIFYPITGGLPMILAALCSPLFHEKLTLKTIIGVCAGVLAV